jgi:hypothetical protein
MVEPAMALVGVNEEIVGGGAKPLTESPMANFVSDNVPVYPVSVKEFPEIVTPEDILVQTPLL